MTDLLRQLFGGKAWTIYPFIPPVFSLALSLLIIPLYDHMLNNSLQAFLNQRNYGDKFRLINGILKARALQLAYLTEVPVFLISVITTLQSNYPKLLVGIVIAALVVALLIFPKVFLSQPDYLATTKFPEKRLMFLSRLRLTQLSFHALILACLNLILIAVIAVSLPAA